MKPGEWLCGKCGQHNWAKRSKCFRCANGRARAVTYDQHVIRLLRRQEPAASALAWRSRRRPSDSEDSGRCRDDRSRGRSRWSSRSRSSDSQDSGRSRDDRSRGRSRRSSRSRSSDGEDRGRCRDDRSRGRSRSSSRSRSCDSEDSGRHRDDCSRSRRTAALETMTARLPPRRSRARGARRAAPSVSRRAGVPLA